MLRMQPTVFYRKKLEICIVTQEKNKFCPETIRAHTRDARPEILAARLQYVEAFSLSIMILRILRILHPEGLHPLKTASLTFTIMLGLGSIYDNSISQSDASTNSVRMLTFWPDDKPEPDGEVYAQPESDLQILVCTSTKRRNRVSCRAFVRPLVFTCDDTKRTRVVWCE
jgi:hypothetical protein